MDLPRDYIYVPPLHPRRRLSATSSSVPETANDARLSQASCSQSEPTFPHFLDLPAELRVRIYHMAAYEDMNNVRTIGHRWGRENTDDTPVVKTQQAHRFSRGLWQVSREARQEVERVCFELPVRFVTDPGANIVNMNQGPRHRSMVSNLVGDRPFHRETTFFMDEPTVIEVFNLLYMNSVHPQTLHWLTNLMLDRRTFQHVLGEYHSFSRDGTAAPFAKLTGLQRLVVGFLYRWQDVAMLEGRYDDVLTEVQVERNTQAAEELQWVVRSPAHLHPLLEVMITSTVRQTQSQVRELEQAGVEVVWGVIRTGITRRPDIFEWFLTD